MTKLIGEDPHLRPVMLIDGLPVPAIGLFGVKGMKWGLVARQPMDERWENVFAYVGPPMGWIMADNAEEEGLWQDVTEFLIEIRYKDRFYYCKQYVHKDNLVAGRPFVFGLILDEMVKQIDSYLAEGES